MTLKNPDQAVLFDLDGTLADTAPDLAAVLNAMRRERGLAPLPIEAVRVAVSHGTAGLIELGFGPLHPEAESLRQTLADGYRVRIAEDTVLFPGMADVLDELDARGIPWGVVTNKPARLTDPLMDALGLTARTCCVISGDTLPQNKPHPAPILHGCQLAGVPPERCLYVGDAERDIEAGRRAGTRTLIALYGYLPPETRLDAWQADGTIACATDLLDWLDVPDTRRTAT